MHARIVRDGLERFYTLRGRTVTPVGGAALQPHDFTWLATAVQTAEAGDGRTAELVLEVQGISCVGCVWLIEKLFHRRGGALRIDVNAAQGRLLWRWERGRFDGARFARELQGFGYLVGPPGERAQWPDSRGLRLRLGLCAAFAMNTMMFVLPSYFGLERASEFYRLFDRLAATFATAALLTGGSYFAKRAWAGVRLGVMNLDVPITLGLALGYGGSLYGWLNGAAHLVYFDFVAVFSFLMLVGRWTQEVAVERNRNQLLSLSREPQEVEMEGPPETGKGRPESGNRRPESANNPEIGASLAQSDQSAPSAQPVSTFRSPVSGLKCGQIFHLRAGQIAPVAATLLSEAATFTTEWINGETEPRDLRTGQRVPAGAASVSRVPLRLQAVEDWADSALARLLATTGAQGFRHTLAERIIRTYLLVIVVLALAGGGGWWWWTGGDTLKALQVTIAVLVISCPCGIGVSFPLVEELAVAAMRRSGVFVRELSLFPRLRRIHQVVFDKTGTLTLETPALQNPEALAALSRREREILWELVADNHHPVARALHEALAQFCAETQNSPGACADAQTPAGEWAVAHQSKIENLKSEMTEVVGQGVKLGAPDGLWSLGRPEFAGGELSADRSAQSDRSGNPQSAIGTPPSDDAVFTHDGRVRARFRFAEAARADARRELAALQREGRAVFILSGDRAEKVAALAADLGVPAAHALGGSTPEMKRDWLRQHDAAASLMLGDGANDSLAFDAAGARGTPVIHRGVLERKSDFYYLGRGLGGIRRLFHVAELRRRTVRRVFVFAVCYNVGTVTLALAGRVNPLVAAVAMPVSSLLSVALATGGMRRAFREEASAGGRSPAPGVVEPPAAG